MSFIGHVLAHNLFRIDPRRPRELLIQMNIELARLWRSIPESERTPASNDGSVEGRGA